MNHAFNVRKVLLMPVSAATAYCGVVILLLFAVVSSVQDMLDARADVAASTSMLEQLGGR